MENDEQKSGGNSFIGDFFMEVIAASIFRFFGWVIAGIAGLFMGD